MSIKINDPMWHPCSIDIIEYKVISIREYDGFTHYVLKAKDNVGACGRVEVVVSENKGKLTMIELLDEKNLEYVGGLWDFIEGSYYTNKDDASLEFYRQQETFAWSSMDAAKRRYNETKLHYEKVKLIISKIDAL